MAEENTWHQEDLAPIRDRVYLHLKKAILDGTYQPGDRLIERELADLLGISRTPIREALFRLESQGFVVTIPRKGVVVAEISHDEILEVFTILSVLEALAVKLAAKKMDVETSKQFQKTIDQLDHLLERDKQEWKTTDEADFSELQIHFYEILYSAMKSPRLYEMLSSLHDYIRAFASIGYELPGRQRKAILEHRQILEAVMNQEVNRAEELAKIHIENSKKAYLESLQGRGRKYHKM